MKLVLNPGIQMYPFEGDPALHLIVCTVPDSSGRPRHYSMPTQLCDLLSAFDGRQERSEATALMASRSGGRYNQNQIEKLTEDFLIPRGILVAAGSAPSIVKTGPRLDRYLFCKVRFLRAGVVRPLARCARFLFYPASWKVLVPVAVLTHLWFYGMLMGRNMPQLNSLGNSSLPWLLLLFLVGGLLHEFGHAAALTRFGGTQAGIGFGIYICFVALFTDLSEAWRLPSRQRVVVDLGGMYFQAILLIAAAVAYSLTRWPVLSYWFIFTDLQIATNLNPLIRLDGYWALADALRMPNLRTQSVRMVRFLFFRPQRSTLGSITPRSRRIVQAYFACSLLFFGYLLYTISLQVASVIRGFPGMATAAFHRWGAAPWTDAASVTFAALWRALLLVGVAIMLVKALLWVCGQVMKSPAYRGIAKEPSVL